MDSNSPVVSQLGTGWFVVHAAKPIRKLIDRLQRRGIINRYRVAPKKVSRSYAHPFTTTRDREVFGQVLKKNLRDYAQDGTPSLVCVITVYRNFFTVTLTHKPAPQDADPVSL